MDMECANFRFDHRLGTIYGYIGRRGLRNLVLPRKSVPHAYELHSAANSVLSNALRAALEHYFAGVPVDFSDIPLDLTGATPFRQHVWLTARELRWGETCTYAGLGERMGRGPGVARAVGQALGANPAPIVVPCHRILAADGLGGFGAGLTWKRELLRVEAG
ncbi:MAG: methylated-DNA--[protein]-cysteine S-methyltransferase [Nitrospiraceae bacterium]|nr:methylated-DNA--[protein]-cysteine S-methyltransferase [Nitrospiraceae bacterium]